MSLKRNIIELIVQSVATVSGAKDGARNAPESIFVLRNNDIGDLLVITPLFEALKLRFPFARIVAGVGSWNMSILQNNPYISGVLPVNAPWHNKFCCRYPHNSPKGFLESARYIWSSPEVEAVRSQRFDIGIDILGSPEGSLFLLRAGIPHRLGVKGYAGGHSAAQAVVSYNPDEHVGRAALRFAELLGAERLPEARPQLFLTPEEQARGESLWGERQPDRARIVIGPGGGFVEKCWPVESYQELAARLMKNNSFEVAVVGGAHDTNAGALLASAGANVHDFTNKLSLRETFALTSRADLVVCNSSMLMHVSAAFSKPSLVMLGDAFPSATKHLAQWGYPGLSQVLGKDINRQAIYTPDEAFTILQESFSSHSPSPTHV